MHAQIASPDTCLVEGYIYGPDLQRAAGEKVYVLKTIAPGFLTTLAKGEFEADSTGWIRLTLFRNSRAWLYGRKVNGLERSGGVELVIPDAATARIETLVPPATLSPAYVVAVPLPPNHGDSIKTAYDKMCDFVPRDSITVDTTGFNQSDRVTRAEDDIAELYHENTTQDLLIADAGKWVQYSAVGTYSILVPKHSDSAKVKIDNAGRMTATEVSATTFGYGTLGTNYLKFEGTGGSQPVLRGSSYSRYVSPIHLFYDWDSRLLATWKPDSNTIYKKTIALDSLTSRVMLAAMLESGSTSRATVLIGREGDNVGSFNFYSNAYGTVNLRRKVTLESSRGMAFQTGSAYEFAWLTTLNNIASGKLMTLTGGGKLGVGIDYPANSLEVNGNGVFNPDSLLKAGRGEFRRMDADSTGWVILNDSVRYRVLSNCEEAFSELGSSRPYHGTITFEVHVAMPGMSPTSCFVNMHADSSSGYQIGLVNIKSKWGYTNMTAGGHAEYYCGTTHPAGLASAFATHTVHRQLFNYSDAQYFDTRGTFYGWQFKWGGGVWWKAIVEVEYTATASRTKKDTPIYLVGL